MKRCAAENGGSERGTRNHKRILYKFGTYAYAFNDVTGSVRVGRNIISGFILEADKVV